MKLTVLALAPAALLATIACAAAGSGRDIPGYFLGDRSLPPAPISMAEFEEIKKSALFTEDDARALRMSRAVLEPRVDEILDVWYGFVGQNDHLLRHFVDRRSGDPDAAYLDAVRKRFGRWILDTADADYDASWLAYQFEIGRRHHRVGKNTTDGADSSPLVPLRHLQALTIPITTTLRPFLASGGHTEQEIDAMHAAWVKSVTIQAILWSYPYVTPGDF